MTRSQTKNRKSLFNFRMVHFDTVSRSNQQDVEIPVVIQDIKSEVAESHMIKHQSIPAEVEYIEDYDDLETFSSVETQARNHKRTYEIRFPLPPYSRTDPRLNERISPLPARRSPKSSATKDTLLRRLGRNKIDRKLNEIRSLVPLLRCAIRIVP